MKQLPMVLLALGMLIRPGSALAHKVKCFATAEGAVVSGYAWMGGGGRPRNVPFKVFGPDGTLLHEGQTNEKGEFAFVPSQTCDLEVVVEAGEGHMARFTVRAEDMAMDTGTLLVQLRRELAEYQERQRWQDVLAGLGYIAGLAGAAFFFFGARRKNRE